MTAPVQPSAGSSGAARPPLVEALKVAVLGEHERLLATMFRNIEAAVDEPGDVTAADVRARLRVGRPVLERGYQRALSRLFTPQQRSAGGSVDRELGRYSLSPSEALEEQLRLTALERAAAQQHPEARLAVEEGLRANGSNREPSINPSVLAPAAAIQAFRHGLEAIDAGLKARLYLYGVFDRCVLSGLDSVYAAAMALLKNEVAQPELPMAASSLTSVSVDVATRDALVAARDGGGSAQERDRRLARELLAILERDAAGAIAQRISLLGLLIEHAGKVAELSVRISLDRLRWPLIKIAIADGAVFEQASHPVRLALRDFRGAVASGALLEIERRVMQVEISADFVLPLLGRLPLLTPAAIGRFNEQLGDQERTLQEARLAAARRTVADVLDRCTLGFVRPSGLRLFLRAGWGPLLTRRFLQGGKAESWQRGVRQLETLLAALASPATRVRDFEPHINQAGSELFAEGLHADRVERLLLGLREAYDELHVLRVEEIGAAPHSSPVTISPGDGCIDFEPEGLALSDSENLKSTRLPSPDASLVDGLDLELRPV